MIKKIYDIILCNNVIYKLIDQQINFNIDLSYKLLKLKKELDEIEQMMVQRWIMLFGEDYKIENFTQEQFDVYNLTLQAEVDITDYNINLNDIINTKGVELSINDIEYLDNFFKTI